MYSIVVPETDQTCKYLLFTLQAMC